MWKARGACRSVGQPPSSLAWLDPAVWHAALMCIQTCMARQLQQLCVVALGCLPHMFGVAPILIQTCLASHHARTLPTPTHPSAAEERATRVPNAPPGAFRQLPHDPLPAADTTLLDDPRSAAVALPQCEGYVTLKPLTTSKAPKDEGLTAHSQSRPTGSGVRRWLRRCALKRRQGRMQRAPPTCRSLSSATWLPQRRCPTTSLRCVGCGCESR